MRIGIFSDSINIPPKEGINVHTYSVAKSLAHQPDSEVLLIVCDRGWLDLDILKDQPFDTLVLPSSDFYDYKKIASLSKEYSLDILQTYMVYFAATVLGKASYMTKIPMCVEFHDLEKTVAPLYLTDEAEIAFHDRLQRQAGSLASMVRVMSAFDYKYINQTWPELNDITVWIPVNIQDPFAMTNLTTSRNGALLFIGNTSYPPNAAAATYIQDVLAPRIPQASVTLVGRGTERFSGRNIHSLGMVDSVTEILRTHTIGLAPIFEGSGMKIKLLDYLSAGLPVITTPLGAYGYPESEAIIIEENTDKWPPIIEQLLQDQVKLRQLGSTARELFLEHFDLGRNIHKLADGYRSLQYSAPKQPTDFDDVVINQNDIYWLREIRETPRPPVSGPHFFEGTK